jgi:hypothetical protein
MKITWENVMRYVLNLGCIAAFFCLAVLSGMAFADEKQTNANELPSVPYAKQVQSMVAADDGDTTTGKSNIPSGNPNADFREPWISGSKVHEYLGLATLGAALATSLTAPSSCHSNSNCVNGLPPTTGTHQTLGRTTGVLALATVATGLLFHWDDMHFDDGLKDPDTQHWLLASTGALLLADAVNRAPAKSHAAQAEAGAGLMLIAVKISW